MPSMGGIMDMSEYFF